MKKSLLVLLLAILSFFMFVGISQAGQCIYLDYRNGYSCSEVNYFGTFVSFVLYTNNACEKSKETMSVEINCARQMVRMHGVDEGWGDHLTWDSIDPGGWPIVAMQKLCK